MMNARLHLNALKNIYAFKPVFILWLGVYDSNVSFHGKRLMCLFVLSRKAGQSWLASELC